MSEKKSLSALEQWKKRKSKKAFSSIEPMPDDAKTVRSHGQERLWLLEQLYPEQNLYTYAHQYQIEGSFKLDAFKDSLQLLVNRHEILRTIYPENGEKQQVQHDQDFTFEVKKCHNDSAKKLDQHIKSFIKRPFNLIRDLSLRILCLETNEQHFTIVLTIHHIAGDAWSMNVINEELSAIYNASIQNQPIDLSPPAIQYKDFAYWQRSKSTNESDLAYWKSQLKPERFVTNFPKEKSVSNFEGKTFIQNLTSSLKAQLENQAKAQKVTPFAYLLCAFHVLLYKYTGSADQLIGSPFSIRDNPILEKLVGFFNETFVLRAPISEGDSFENALEKTQATLLDAMAHKSVTFDEVVNAVQPERNEGENPLFQTMFLYNEPPTKLHLEGLTVEEKVLPTYISKFDLTLFVSPSENGFELKYEYNAGISDKLIEELSNNFEFLLRAVIEDPKKPIKEIEFPHAEREQDIKEPYIGNYSSIIDLIFDDSVDRQKEAVVFSDQSLTYQELDEWSDHMASVIYKDHQGECIGLYADRSLEMIVGILAILKAGCAYVPLDPSYPKERLKQYVEEAGIKTILLGSDKSTHFSGLISIQIEKGKDVFDHHHHDLLSETAYIIFTSGSTGKPKGVVISHANLIYSNLARREYYTDPVDTFLLMSSFSFDSSVAGIFWTLSAGGTLVIPPDRIEQDLPKLEQLITDQQVTHTLLLPSLYQTILNHTRNSLLQSLQVVIVAGEACTSSLVQMHLNLMPKAKLYNEYGPTEATVWCIAKELTIQEAFAPIGQPIPYTYARVLDDSLRMTPHGMPGELYIGGPTLSLGYLNHPDLTNERFITDPYDPGQKLYKTGDRVRKLNNGDLLYLGRNDDQIKIRGHRVELNEIKEAIENIDGVNETFIKVGDSSQLVAFVEGGSLNAEEIIMKLKATLPAYMVPALSISESLPRLPNGKVDHSKLDYKPSENTSIVEPNSDIEDNLLKLWYEILPTKEISVTDNFFEIGGDSILSIELIAKSRSLGHDLKPTDIFKFQTIRELAKAIEQKKEDQWSNVVPMKTSGSEPPLFCLHSGGAYALFYKDFAKHISGNFPVYAIQPKGIDGIEHHQKSIREMAELYLDEIRKIQPTGPYFLLGTCFSNAVGLEMIHLLQAENESIGAMYIVDSAPAYLAPPSPNGEKKPVKRMFELIKNGNWDSLYKKFRNRWIRYQKKSNRHLKNEVERDLDDMIDSLNELYARYTWRPAEVPITLIRSSEFAQRKNKQFHLDHWTILSNNNLEVLEVDGHHLTLFKEPEVQQLARTISQHKASLHHSLQVQ